MTGLGKSNEGGEVTTKWADMYVQRSDEGCVVKWMLRVELSGRKRGRSKRERVYGCGKGGYASG